MSPGDARPAALLLSCVLGWSCEVKPPPGDQPMGQYVVSATGAVLECQLEEVTGADFSFNATLTRDSASQVAWLTLNGYSREGVFDGQVFTSTADAGRVFAECKACATRVVETLTVAVLSRTQFQAAQRQCPPNALDGGVAAPDADAGISGPTQTTAGYDATRLCGELTTVVLAGGQTDGGACDPRCDGCTVRYQLVGERR